MTIGDSWSYVGIENLVSNSGFRETTLHLKSFIILICHLTCMIQIELVTDAHSTMLGVQVHIPHISSAYPAKKSGIGINEESLVWQAYRARRKLSGCRCQHCT